MYWILLSLGATFIVMLLAGVVIYLVLTVKAINLNRRQSNFIDSVTHELKSPIASMKLYLQTLHRRQVPQEEQASFYQFMLEDLDRLDRLINQLLDAGRLEPAAPTATWKTFRSRRCCEDVRGRSASATACRSTRSGSTWSPAPCGRGGWTWTSSSAT